MIDHPSLTMIPFIALVILGKKNGFLFKASSLIMPVAACLTLMLGSGVHSYDLPNFTILWEFSNLNKLIGLAFLLVLMMANAYAVGQKKPREVIIGSLYSAAVFITLMAKDFISMFIGLELMMVAASILIFIGSYQKNAKTAIRTTKKYLLTHLVSGNLILVGIAYIIAKGGSSVMLIMANLLDEPGYSCWLVYMILTGLIINIAAFPFSGWIVNYYKSSSSAGFMYLISFTSKVSVVLLLKLFGGCQYLQYVACMTILYAGFKAIKENNMFSLLGYLSIISIGVMSFGISVGSEGLLIATSCYLFIHIIYKALLTLWVATIRDSKNIVLCSEIGKVNHGLLLSALLISTCLMINIPPGIGFYSKIIISGKLQGIWYFIMILANLLSFMALPWKKYILSPKINGLKLNPYTKYSLIIGITAALSAGFGWNFITILPLPVIDINITINELVKQLVILVIGAILIMGLRYSRNSAPALNLLEFLGNVFSRLYNRFWLKRSIASIETGKKWSIQILEEQSRNKARSVHDQSAAVLIVFVLIIVVLVLSIQK